MTAARPTRRIVFHGLGALGVAAILAGCGSDDRDEGESRPGSGTALATTAEVPVGGGVIVDGVVITQPTAGTFKAFTATCTHQGSSLDAVQPDGIHCPLHGSLFSIEDGSATQGPATAALTAVDIEVAGDQIVAA